MLMERPTPTGLQSSIQASCPNDHWGNSVPYYALRVSSLPSPSPITPTYPATVGFWCNGATAIAFGRVTKDNTVRQGEWEWGESHAVAVKYCRVA